MIEKADMATSVKVCLSLSQLHKPCVNISKLATVLFAFNLLTCSFVRCICELFKRFHDLDIRNCAGQSYLLDAAAIYAFQLTSMSVPAGPVRMTAPVLMTSTVTIVHVQQHIREVTVKVKPNFIFTSVRECTK